MNSIDTGRFKTVMGHFATGVTIVTALEGETPVGFTAQSFVSLSIDPPLVAVCPARSSTSWPRIAAADGLCINILGADQEPVCRAMATPGADKFSGVGWSAAPRTGAPLIDGSLAWVEGRIEATHPAGDHEIVVVRVEDMGEATSEGHPHGPLLFYRAGFGSFTS
ncbi:MAG TPA: flavin reductase family protein [Acidimicrobiales bacterium]|nr:flavin reductase family protein [Acidimicrobiales bacterium]